MSIDVVLQNPDHIADVPSLIDFQQWVNLALRDQLHNSPKSLSQVSIRITSLDEMTALNSQFRQKNKPTNVLSFPQELPPGIPQESLGDIAICAEVVATEAQAADKPVIEHWAHLTIHGILHLLGYDHVDDNDAALMEALEIRLLQELNIANPYEIN